MSFQYVEVTLDRPRKLLFRLADLRDLCRRLGGGLGSIPFVQVLQRLEQLDLEALVWAVLYGLRHEDRKIDLQRAGDLVQGYMDREQSLTGLLQAVSEALEKSGIIQPRRESGEIPAGEAGSPGSPTLTS